MPPIKPLIYAELLSNIRQISILAFLDTPSDPATKAELSADGTRLTLHHAEQNIKLELPGQVVANSQLRGFPVGSLELSWRLPLAGDFQRADVDIAQTIEAPWSAKDMVIGEQVLECRRCSATIVEADQIKEWKDLPSEGWAEMMDFWHCHKPSDHENLSHGEEKQTDLASSKGYGANTKFTAQAGIGFVDHSSFLLAEDDCNLPAGGNEDLLYRLVADTNTQNQPLVAALLRQQSISFTLFFGLWVSISIGGFQTLAYQFAVSSSRSWKSRDYNKRHLSVKRTIHCENGWCLTTIGFSDPHNEGIRLFKWCLRMRTFENPAPTNLSGAVLEPSMASIISAQFLAIMNASCVSRLVLLPTPVTGKFDPIYPGLSIWIFNPSIRYTSAYFYRCRKTHVSTSGKPGILAMKILWKPCAHIRDPSADNDNESVEELEFPGAVLHEFQHYLEEVAKRFLPPSARKLQDWNVALLERYEQRQK
ncbi:hypothetical protein SBOR_5494 [Sclerotinia borealis F-4128]|uniref:Ubiquitin-conjugating enzyme E2C-binding protein n=1 Tax=Sclerotinia borealis (strain F-4128) TaxID=1432307 RepID=W9CHW3_SCLBF|nr:hypothetical protein SBOR_5494 [Sclerotinia borealis F-4128]